MKKIAIPALILLLIMSMVGNVYLFTRTSKLNTSVAELENNLTIANDEVVTLKAELQTMTAEIETLKAEQVESLATIKELEDEIEESMIAAMTQEDFDSQFGAELTSVAQNTEMSVADRTSTINEIGDMFSCDVSVYIAMITADGGTGTTTPPVTPPPVVPPVTTPTPPPVVEPPVTTPPKTTPPATSTPGATPQPGGSTGGASTEGKTGDEIDKEAEGTGWGTPGPGGQGHLNPGNEDPFS